LRERPVANVLKRPATSFLATASIASFLFFKLLVPFWRTLAQSEAKQISRSRRQPTAYPQRLGVSFRDRNEDFMAIREKRAAIVNPVTTFRRALTVGTTCSWASATDRPILAPVVRSKQIVTTNAL
jgi:hypothetical protein